MDIKQIDQLMLWSMLMIKISDVILCNVIFILHRLNVDDSSSRRKHAETLFGLFVSSRKQHWQTVENYLNWKQQRNVICDVLLPCSPRYKCKASVSCPCVRLSVCLSLQAYIYTDSPEGSTDAASVRIVAFVRRQILVWTLKLYSCTTGTTSC